MSLGLLCVDPLSRHCPEEALQQQWIEETARVVAMAHCRHDESRGQSSYEADVSSGAGIATRKLFDWHFYHFIIVFVVQRWDSQVMRTNYLPNSVSTHLLYLPIVRPYGACNRAHVHLRIFLQVECQVERA